MADDKTKDAYHEFRFKLGTKPTLKILLSEKPDEPQLPEIKDKKDNGIMNPYVPPPDDIIPKRPRPKGLRFFDMGQLLDDSDNSTLYQPPVTPEPGTSFLGFIVPPASAINYQTMMAEIESVIETNLNDLEGTFKECPAVGQTARWVRISFTRSEGDVVTDKSMDEVDEWTDKGLVLTLDQLNTLKIFPNDIYDPFEYSFNQFNFGFKITNVMDHTADEVSFTPSLSMKIFLYPVILFHSSLIDYYNGITVFGPSSDFIQYQDFLNASYQTFPRSDLELYASIYDNLILTSDYNKFSYRLAAMIRVWDSARAFRGIRTWNGPGSGYSHVYSNLDPVLFPFSTIYQPDGTTINVFPVQEVVPGLGVQTTYGPVTDFGVPKLKMIIEKDGQQFFFWRMTL